MARLLVFIGALTVIAGAGIVFGQATHASECVGIAGAVAAIVVAAWPGR